MKHSIYYFSGTGNSLYVTKRISSIIETDVKSILNESNEKLEGKVGLVFPVHMNKLPWPFENFVNNQDFSNVDYLYAVGTHGGVPGKVEFFLDHILEKKGRSLDSYFEVEMINNTPKGVAPKIFMKLKWENDITAEKIDEMVKRTNPQINFIIDAIKNEKKNFQTIKNNKKIMFWDKLLWKIGGRPKLEFIVDDTCTKCGICEQVCLSKRITVTDQVHFKSDVCYFCYACFNYCPEQSILVKHYEKKLGRYHYPEIENLEIAKQKK